MVAHDDITPLQVSSKNRGHYSVIPYVRYRTPTYDFCRMPKRSGEVPPTLADLLQMPKSLRQREEEELAAYTARWLELADTALSATEKAAKTLELAREEQQRMRNDIKRRLDNYAKKGG